MSEIPDASPSPIPPPPLVAIAGWLVPGAGYWLIGHRARAITVGVTIITLFLAGTLIGGVRAIQVPGYGEQGGSLYLVGQRAGTNSKGNEVIVYAVREHRAGEQPPSDELVVANARALLGEIGNKPWSICQVMTGPVALLGGAASVRASRAVEVQGDDGRTEFVAPGVMSHSRVNEIAVLYTAVAGLLNLLSIIDAAGRADDARAAAGGERSGVFHALLMLVRRGTR